MKISLVIPVFNEQDSITDVVRELDSYMSKYISGRDQWELVIVNDGSTDKTLEIVKKISKSNKHITIADLVRNFGRGKALRTGFEHATGDIVVTLDADLSYAPYHIERMISKLLETNADIVIASAYGRGGTSGNVPFFRLWISKLGNKVLSYMFGTGITVLTCMVRAYKKEFIDRLDLFSMDKEIHLEILSKAKMINAKIVEVPADLYWRDFKVKTDENKITKRRSTMKIKKTSGSHMFFALLNNPGIVFRIPGFILMSISALIFLITFTYIFIDISSGNSFYHSLRFSMISGKLSWMTMSISFILGIQFFTLGFLTNQNKQNYEENYKTLNAIYSELRKRK